VIFTTPRELSSRFEGFTSRWITFISLWRYSRPSRTCQVTLARSLSGTVFRTSSTSERAPAFMYSRAMCSMCSCWKAP